MKIQGDPLHGIFAEFPNRPEDFERFKQTLKSSGVLRWTHPAGTFVSSPKSHSKVANVSIEPRNDQVVVRISAHAIANTKGNLEELFSAISVSS